MKYDFKSPVDRKNTSAVKSHAGLIKDSFGLNYYEDTIPMWIADMDFTCSPVIVERLKQRVDKLIFGYTEISGEYKESILNWYKTRYQVQLKAKWIVYSNGTVIAIKNAINAFTAEGDEIIIQSPVYAPFAEEILAAKRLISDNTLVKDKNNKYYINFTDFEERCKSAKMFILCNPHNPTGNIWSKEIVQKMIDIANKYNVLFFSDEVHSDLIRKNKEFTSVLNLKNTKNCIVATAINKSFNLAGLQGTNLIIQSKKLRNTLNKHTGLLILSPFTLEATIAAYSSNEWLEELRNVLDKNFAYIKKFLKKNMPDMPFNIPDATYLAWLDFNHYLKKYNISEQDLLEKLADEAHIIVEHGSLFGEAGRGFIRMNIACPFKTLKKALERIANLNF